MALFVCDYRTAGITPPPVSKCNSRKIEPFVWKFTGWKLTVEQRRFGSPTTAQHPCSCFLFDLFSRTLRQRGCSQSCWKDKNKKNAARKRRAGLCRYRDICGQNHRPPEEHRSYLRDVSNPHSWSEHDVFAVLRDTSKYVTSEGKAEMSVQAVNSPNVQGWCEEDLCFFCFSGSFFH